MSYRNILVPILGERHDEVAVRAASRVARTWGGHIDGLHVQKDLMRELSLRDESMSAVLIRDLATSVEESNKVAEQAARDRFERVLSAENIPLSVEAELHVRPSATWTVVAGREVDIVSAKGGAYDLIVLPLEMLRSDTDTTDVFEALLFRSGRPVLLAPSVLPPTVGKTIVLCWNKSVQSARAVAAAMPYITRADRIVLVSVVTNAKQGPDPSDVARTLAWHDIQAEIVEVDPDGRSVGRILLDECAKASADLLVMGGYSRNRWSEVILGGVTRYVLEQAEVPTLMAH